MRCLALLPALFVMTKGGLGFAQPSAPDSSGLDLTPGVARTEPPEGGTYVHGFGSLMLGKGLRLNNPFRLATPLGDDAAGVAFTAAYLDLGLGAAFGPPDALQHGGEASLSLATDGIAQEVLSLSYVAILPLAEQALVKGRAGLPFILGPDPNVGLELAVGGAWLFTGGLGLSAELVGSLFYGAATFEKSSTSVPVISFEIGAWFDHEVLP